MQTPADIRYFAAAAGFRLWLKRNHAKADVLWVGFHKRATGARSMTWPESVDEALCVGWVDGIRKRVDDARYTIRFTARRSGSVWSAVNIKRMRQLSDEQRVQPAGKAAFDKRRENRFGIYAYEQRSVELPEPYAKPFRTNKKAWEFFRAQPAGYRKTIGWWVVSAKQESTRLRRLHMLIADSAAGRRVGVLR